MPPLSPPKLRAGGPALIAIATAMLIAAFVFYSVPSAGATPSYPSPLTQVFTGTLVAKIGATNQVDTNVAQITVTSVSGFGSQGGFDGDISEVKISTVSGTPVNGDLLVDTTTTGWTRQVGSTSKFTLNTQSNDAAQVYINGAWRQLKKTIGKPTVSATFTSNGALLSLIVSGQATNGKVMTAVEIKNGAPGMDIAPTVVEFDPLDASIDVPTTVNPVVDFNEPVDTDASAFSLVCNDEPVTFTISGSGTSSITIIPDAELPILATCVLTVDQSLVSDVDTNDPVDTGTGEASTTFSTGGSLDTAPEVVLESSSPSTQGATIGYTSKLHIVFDEDITASAGAFTVVCDSANVPLTATKDNSDSYELVSNGGTWGSDTAECVLTVHQELIEDDDTDDPPGNMVADFLLTFNLVAEDPPIVISIENLWPGSCFGGGSGESCGNFDENNQPIWVAPVVKFQINFTEEVDVAAGAVTLVCDSNPITLTMVDSTAGAYTAVWSIIADPDDTEMSSVENCTLTISAAGVTDTDLVDPPNAMEADKTLDVFLTPG